MRRGCVEVTPTAPPTTKELDHERRRRRGLTIGVPIAIVANLVVVAVGALADYTFDYRAAAPEGKVVMRRLVRLVCVLAVGLVGCGEEDSARCQSAADCADGNECTGTLASSMDIPRTAPCLTGILAKTESASRHESFRRRTP